MELRGPLLMLFSYITNPNSTSIQRVIISFFVVALIIFMVFPIHECAHGLTAKILGDDTAEREGRLTLNPMRHIDPIGVFIMLLFPIGYARPVSVNPSRFRKVSAKTGMALTAAAGPLSNIIISYLLMIIFKCVYITGYVSGDSLGYLYMAFDYAIYISLYLAVLNLIPVPPLDGSKILFFFLKPKWHYTILRHQNVISLILLILLLTGTLTPILGLTSLHIYRFLDILSGFIFRIIS